MRVRRDWGTFVCRIVDETGKVVFENGAEERG